MIIYAHKKTVIPSTDLIFKDILNTKFVSYCKFFIIIKLLRLTPSYNIIS